MGNLKRFQDPDEFQQAQLGGRGGHPFSRRSRWLPVLREHGLRGCARAHSMRCPVGWVHCGDFLLHVAGNTWSAGLAVEFCKATPVQGGGPEEQCVIIRHCRVRVVEDTPTSWLFEPRHEWFVVHNQRVFHSASHVRDGADMRVLFPLYARQLLRLG
jgi:hypothetical protein